MVIVNERNEVPTISAISCQILTFYHFRAPLLFSDPVLQCTFFSNVHLAMRTFFKVCLLAATTIVVATSFIKLSSKKCAFRNQYIVSVVCTQAVQSTPVVLNWRAARHPLVRWKKALGAANF